MQVWPYYALLFSGFLSLDLGSRILSLGIQGFKFMDPGFRLSEWRLIFVRLFVVFRFRIWGFRV